ncbi:MAG: hypothetical protein ACJAS1_006602 [Oleiphilaceae bacterium]|jgi:hypothetical protein
MSSIGFEVLKIALKDVVEKQKLIAEELKELPEQSNVRNLVTEQTHLLEETLVLINLIA